MNLDYKSIGKRIKIARIKTDLTQEQLSEIVEITPAHMSNIETGKAKVSLTTIVNIANALSITVDDILCDSVIHSKVQFERGISELLEDCNTYEIRILHDIIEASKKSLRKNTDIRE